MGPARPPGVDSGARHLHRDRGGVGRAVRHPGRARPRSHRTRRLRGRGPGECRSGRTGLWPHDPALRRRQPQDPLSRRHRMAGAPRCARIACSGRGHARGAGHPAHPGQHLRRRAGRRSGSARRGPGHGHEQLPGGHLGRAADRPAPDPGRPTQFSAPGDSYRDHCRLPALPRRVGLPDIHQRPAADQQPACRVSRHARRRRHGRGPRRGRRAVAARRAKAHSLSGAHRLLRTQTRAPRRCGRPRRAFPTSIPHKYKEKHETKHTVCSGGGRVAGSPDHGAGRVRK